MYDVVIIGKGPAGISASLYTSRGNLNTLVIGGDSWLSKAYGVDNYYGFPNGIDGQELLDLGEEQAKNLGVEIIDDKVIGIEPLNGLYKVITNHSEYEAKSVLISSGETRNKAKIENIDNYEGKGIHYCVVCDGFFYKDKKVGILGYTDYVIHEAMELVNFSKDITIFTNGNEFIINDTSRDILEKNNFNVNNKKITKFLGENNLNRIVFDDTTQEEIEGLFIAYGSASSSDFARKLGIVLNNNIISVDKNQQTNIPGIFAAGDCAADFKQISVSVGQGAIAGQKIVEYIRNLGK